MHPKVMLGFLQFLEQCFFIRRCPEPSGAIRRSPASCQTSRSSDKKRSGAVRRPSQAPTAVSGSRPLVGHGRPWSALVGRWWGVFALKKITLGGSRMSTASPSEACTQGHTWHKPAKKCNKVIGVVKGMHMPERMAVKLNEQMIEM